MPAMSIISVVEPNGVLVPVEALESIGLQIGDSVDMSLEDGRLILRPVADARRQQQIDDITRDVFERRKDAYQRLA